MILIVDDDDGARAHYKRAVQRLLARIGQSVDVEEATSFEEGERYFMGQGDPHPIPQLVLLDMEFPKGSLPRDPLAGYSLYEKYSSLYPDTQWIFITGAIPWHRLEVAPGVTLHEALYQAQPLDVYEKGEDLSRLELSLKRFFVPKQDVEHGSVSIEVDGENSLDTTRIGRINELTSIAAEDKRGVLLFGEYGVGKKLVSRVIHHLSPRKDNHWEAVVPDDVPSLLEGLEGVTSPDSEAADLHGGTLYIEDIDSTEQDVQLKLLRKATKHDIRLMGGIRTPRQRFRHRGALILGIIDEFIPVDVPSLEERVEDIPVLVDKFRVRFNQRHKGAPKEYRELDKIATFLSSQPWPSNVAGLRAAVEEVFIKTPSPVITPEDFERVLEAATFRSPYPEPERTGGEPVVRRTSKPTRVITDEDIKRLGL